MAWDVGALGGLGWRRHTGECLSISEWRIALVAYLCDSLSFSQASGVFCHVVGLTGLLALRSFRSTLAPPAVVALDDDPDYGSIVPTLSTALRARGIKRLWD